MFGLFNDSNNYKSHAVIYDYWFINVFDYTKYVCGFLEK